MNVFSKFLIPCMATLVFSSCQGQSAKVAHTSVVGGGCDGCELMYEGIPTVIAATDTSDGWHGKGQKLAITGTVLQRDGRTPTANVIIYYWQTDAQGYYSPKPGMNAKARRHGHIRGWVKTNAQGHYAIYTNRPAPYPDQSMPAHIHLAIKEPTLPTEYYVDELVFDDDPLLTSAKRKALENRGGSGVLRVLQSGDLQVAEHIIVLGLNIPNYPMKLKPAQQSGLEIGEDSPSFVPYHAFGPDKGSRACPVCKYGRYLGVLYFVGNHPDWNEIRQWLTFLETESEKRKSHLKVFFVYGNATNFSHKQRQAQLEEVGKQLQLKMLALTFVPSFSDTETEVNLNRINPEVENTFVIYKHRNIIDKFINLSPTTQNYTLITSRLNEATNDLFQLSEPKHR